LPGDAASGCEERKRCVTNYDFCCGGEYTRMGESRLRRRIVSSLRSIANEHAYQSGIHVSGFFAKMFF
jgi:hypothetical protein